jgi:hypothetical protein
VKRNTSFWVFVFLLALGASEGLAQQQRLDAATKILIPSSARTAAFNSFLAVINLDSQDNAITITARRPDGSVIGTPRSIVLSPNGRFRSTDILGELGGGLGEFGPITVESTNGKILSAVSEVSSVQGPGGFFPGVNTSSAWVQGYMAEVIDTGEGGTAGTFRTNLGLNTVAGTPANVTVTLRGASGQSLGDPELHDFRNFRSAAGDAGEVDLRPWVVRQCDVRARHLTEVDDQGFLVRTPLERDRLHVVEVGAVDDTAVDFDLQQIFPIGLAADDFEYVGLTVGGASFDNDRLDLVLAICSG